MNGFNENDTIPSFNSSELIEEVDDDDDNLEEGIDNNEYVEGVDDTENKDDSSRSSLDSCELMYRPAKRFKSAVANEDLFKMKVMKILKESSEVAGDFAVSGKLDRTPLLAISLKVIFNDIWHGSHRFLSNFFFLFPNQNKRDGADEVIKFPLSESEVTKIIKYFDPSPYGRGTETIVDSTVRSSLQLSPDDFEVQFSPSTDIERFVAKFFIVSYRS